MTKAKGVTAARDGARQTQIFAMLNDAAEKGERCPFVSVMAGRIGISHDTVGRHIEYLESIGLIKITYKTKCSNSRICTIVATGKTTADPTVQRSKVWTPPVDLSWMDVPWPTRTGSDASFQESMVISGVKFEDNAMAHKASLAASPKFYPLRDVMIEERVI